MKEILGSRNTIHVPGLILLIMEGNSCNMKDIPAKEFNLYTRISILLLKFPFCCKSFVSAVSEEILAAGIRFKIHC